MILFTKQCLLTIQTVEVAVSFHSFFENLESVDVSTMSLPTGQTLRLRGECNFPSMWTGGQILERLRERPVGSDFDCPLGDWGVRYRTGAFGEWGGRRLVVSCDVGEG